MTKIGHSLGMIWMLNKNLISSIEGKGLNGYVLKFANLSRGRFVEETNFELFLKNAEEETSENARARIKARKHVRRHHDFFNQYLSPLQSAPCLNS